MQTTLSSEAIKPLFNRRLIISIVIFSLIIRLQNCKNLSMTEKFLNSVRDIDYFSRTARNNQQEGIQFLKRKKNKN